MHTLVARTDARLRRLPDPVLLVGALALVAVIAAVRTLVVAEAPSVDSFLIPVAAVGWLARSAWYAMPVALCAAAASVLTPLSRLGGVSASASIEVVTARLVVYLVVLGLVRAVRHLQLDREKEARSDPLTGLANQREFRRLAVAEIERAQRYPHPLSLAYLDLDGFKTVNDICGHVAGDRLLAEVGRLLDDGVRGIDTVARLGGDEFAVLMPETDSGEARLLAERLRRDLAELIAHDEQHLCCSIGLVTFEQPPASCEELVAAGDELMYRAKRGGKDRIEQATVEAVAENEQRLSSDAATAAPVRRRGRRALHRPGVHGAR